MAWNGFLANVRMAILKKLRTQHNIANPSDTAERVISNDITAEENIPKVWLRIPYLGKQGEYLVKKLISKLKRNLTKQVKFIVIYQTKRSHISCREKTKSESLIEATSFINFRVLVLLKHTLTKLHETYGQGWQNIRLQI